MPHPFRQAVGTGLFRTAGALISTAARVLPADCALHHVSRKLAAAMREI